jgi:predicted nicotinamide N-methyase
MQQSRRDIAPSLIADNRNERRTTPAAVRSIAGFDACVTSIDVGDDSVRLVTVADLERHVDRDALLRADDPPEPPYWAHCWSGARVLAERVPPHAGRVLEVGCGLGLPGIVAATRGARVVFADRVAAPLAFVRASLDANQLDAAGLVGADVLDAPWRGCFDLVLAAEVVYDRATFGPLAGRAAGRRSRPAAVSCWPTGTASIRQDSTTPRRRRGSSGRARTSASTKRASRSP